MFVYRFVPGTGADWVLKIALAVTAGISEEVVYRGVLVQILWYSLGEFWLATGISAIGFVLAHRQQGLQSMLVILAIALLMQWLVQSTGTLLGAMVVHALYDIIAMVVIARQAARDAHEPADQ
jgi:membrane protease YdiL (CAAX protease family)